MPEVSKASPRSHVSPRGQDRSSSGGLSPALQAELDALPKPGYDAWRESRRDALMQGMQADPVNAPKYAFAIASEYSADDSGGRAWDFFATLPASALSIPLMNKIAQLLDPARDRDKLEILELRKREIPDSPANKNAVEVLPMAAQRRRSELQWGGLDEWRKARAALLIDLFERHPGERGPLAALAAVELRAIGDTDRAWALYKRLSPSDVSKPLLRELAFQNLSDASRSGELFEFARTHFPRNFQLVRARFEHLLNTKDLVRCADQFERMTEAGWAQAADMRNLVNAAMKCKDFETARRVLMHAQMFSNIRPAETLVRKVVLQIEAQSRAHPAASELRGTFNMKPRSAEVAGTIAQDHTAPKDLSGLLKTAGISNFSLEGCAAAVAVFEERGDRNRAVTLLHLTLKRFSEPKAFEAAIGKALDWKDAGLIEQFSYMYLGARKHDAVEYLAPRFADVIRLEPFPGKMVRRALSASPRIFHPKLDEMLLELLDGGNSARALTILRATERGDAGALAVWISNRLEKFDETRVPETFRTLFGFARDQGIAIGPRGALFALDAACELKDPGFARLVYAHTGLIEQKDRAAFLPHAIPLLIQVGATDLARDAFVRAKVHEIPPKRDPLSSAIESLATINSTDLASDMARWCLTHGVVPKHIALRAVGSAFARQGDPGRISELCGICDSADALEGVCGAALVAFKMAHKPAAGVEFIRTHFPAVPHNSKPYAADLEYRAGNNVAARKLCEDYLADARSNSGSMLAIAVRLDSLMRTDRMEARQFAESITRVSEGKPALRIISVKRQLGLPSPEIRRNPEK